MKVIFSRSHKPISFLIRAFTWSRWSHIGVIVDDYVIESIASKGVVKTSLEDFKKRYHCYEICTMTNESGWQERAKSQLGKKYDWSAIFSLIVKSRKQDPNKWFCSELAAHASGIFRQERVNRITPEDCYKVSK